MTRQQPDKTSRGRPVIFGEVLFDRFPNGETVLGGAPFNVAWHLQGFGSAPLFISRIGRDEPGRMIRQAMGDWGMDGPGVQTDDQYPTGTVEVSFSGAAHTFDILPDRAYDHIDASLAQASAKDINAALVYHGSLVMRTELVRRTLDGLLGTLHAPVFVDVNLRDPWWRQEDLPHLLDRARWVKVSDEELTLIAGWLGVEANGLEATVRQLQAAHDIALLIVTRGAEGAIAFDSTGENASVQPNAGADVVDTVGAGDAFSSVVLLGLLRQWPLQLVLQRAQTFASRICAQRGATSPDVSMYESLMRHWENDD